MMIGLNKKKQSEEVSQLISWGHWFALFNILFSILVASRYLLVSDWPITLSGRAYALINLIGHFSFITFSCYLLILFPLTFIIRSARWLKIIAAILATVGLTLLLVDAEMFSRFRLHLNLTVWELLLSPTESSLINNWQKLFVFVPVIFLLQMLFASWSWKKLRSLNKRHFAKPLVVIFICCFFSAHLIHIWADAHFYRPITMQKANLPLSYPMTARHFLEKYGLLDLDKYQTQLAEQGEPSAMLLNYPLSKIEYQTNKSGLNLLVVAIDDFDNLRQLPLLSDFANKNIQFDHHYSAATQKYLAIFSLFYGISPNYYDGILASRTPSTLISTLNQQGYNFGLFATDGFAAPLYRQALLTDFSLPESKQFSDAEITQQWLSWYQQQTVNRPWFSFVNYQHADDKLLAQLMESMSAEVLDNTVVVITGLSNTQGHDEQQRLHVPLIIHWPDKIASTEQRLTAQVDVMTTLMQSVLNVKTPAENYSQGDNLFADKYRYNWVSAGGHNQLIVITDNRTIILKPNNNYRIYDQQGNRIRDEKIDLTLYLQLITEMRRFIAD